MQVFDDRFQAESGCHPDSAWKQSGWLFKKRPTSLVHHNKVKLCMALQKSVSLKTKERKLI
jgi:hypothetical protein